MGYETQLQFDTRSQQMMHRSLQGTCLLVPVEDQGNCQCCYAFSALAAVSAAYSRVYNILIKLSIQHAVDTMVYDNPPPPGDKVGCLPNHHYYVFKMLMDYGVHLDYDYNYEEKKERNFSKLKLKEKEYPVMKIGKLVFIDDPMSEDLEKAIKMGQPLVITLEVNDSFRHLKPGVIYQGLTEEDKVEKWGHHSILVIGFGVDKNGVMYLIVQNSWGTWWCKNGVGLVRRDLAKDMMYPSEAKLYGGKYYDKTKYEVEVEEYIPEEFLAEPGDYDVIFSEEV